MVDLLERGLYWLSSYFLEGDVDAHCQLSTPLSDTTMLTSTDDLMTVIEIKGARRLVGSAEFELMAANLSDTLSKVVKSANGAQHSFSIGARSSPESATRLLKEIFTPNLRTSKRYGVDEVIHLSDQISSLASECKEESIYLVLYTHSAGLSPSERERLKDWREQFSKKIAGNDSGMRIGDGFTQKPRVPAPALIPRHESALENLVIGLTMDTEKGGVGVLSEVLEVGAALSLIRRHMDASPFDASWRPRLLGDKSAVVPSVARRGKDSSHLFPMALSRQLVSDPITEVFADVEYAKRGGIFYSGVVLEVGPEEGSLPFEQLTSRLGKQIPWTVNIEISPNGESLRKTDKFYAAIVGAMGDHNKRVKLGWKQIQDMVAANIYVAALRVTFSTWGYSEEEVTKNVSFLKSSIESWGSACASNETGSPGLLSLCGAAGFAKRMPASYLPGPLNEFARMMPIFAPASVWENGQLVAHTKGGRPYPVALGSSLQAYWGALIFAPSGMGKSFLMNMINAGILFAPGLNELPYLTVIDVGPSSRLVMELVKSLLPERLARQIAFIRVRNSKEFCINPFDTQHGCDRPTSVDRDFQISVISTVCANLGPEGERFIGQVIDEAYKLLGRKSPAQRRWQKSMDENTSKVLNTIGYKVSEDTFVWDVVDALFDAGRIEESYFAQRFAVPRLPDLIKASRSKEILDAYREAPSATSELILDVFTRNIQTAQSEYELISDVTRFDIGNARAISIDLEEVVTGTDSEEGKRRAAMMFLFGRRLGAKNYFLRWDEIGPIVPERYREYQEARVKGIEECMKYLEYDEVHYATGIPSMSKRIQEDLRVGRKYKCVTMMASQLLQDFPPAAVNNCFTYFILGSGTDTALGELQSTFGLTSSETLAIRTECTGPGKLFGLFKTTKGTTSQVLHTTAGPFYRWAFSTSKDDALLRREVSNMLDGDYLQAIKRLAKMYPKGTARDEMEAYQRARSDTAESGSFITVFAKNLLLGGKPVPRM